MPFSRMRIRHLMIVAAIVAVVLGCAVEAWRWHPTAIPESEAIRRAEQFIAANGYTDLRANTSRLTPEAIVLSSSVEEELKLRHDTLERKADGAFGGPGGWTIYFRYKYRGMLDAEARRAVVMGPKGDHIRIMHQDAY
jgi:hypothetical protein